ncbi:MAG: hypothetical protein MRY59_11135 [Aquisalinus sp.]|nr:hypothetical protein [Aquisalinus sp.]
MNVIKLDDFRSHTKPLGTIVRVGDFNQQFAHYQSLNQLTGKRAVIDAYNVKRQTDLLNELRAVGFELILDTKAAELACPFKWNGQPRKVEWLPCEPERYLQPSDFNEYMARQIAELAVKNRFHVVLAPSRYVSNASALKTLEQDHEFMVLLRKALDQAGGQNITIASSFIGRLTLLGEEDVTNRMVSLHRDAPAVSLWLRLSGMKRDPVARRVQTTARRLQLLREAGLPVVLDYAAGLEPLSLAALGVTSGLSFGALANDQFSDATWVKPSKSIENSVGDSGRQQYARAPGLGRNLSHAELQLLAEAPKGKRLLFDPANTGVETFDEFKGKAKETALRESVEAISGLSQVPNARRPDHVKTTHLDQCARKARQLSRLVLDEFRAEALKVKSPESLQKRLADYASSLEKTGLALENIVNDSSIRLNGSVALPHLGNVTKGNEIGELQ